MKPSVSSSGFCAGVFGSTIVVVVSAPGVSFGVVVVVVAVPCGVIMGPVALCVAVADVVVLSPVIDTATVDSALPLVFV